MLNYQRVPVDSGFSKDLSINSANSLKIADIRCIWDLLDGSFMYLKYMSFFPGWYYPVMFVGLLSHYILLFLRLVTTPLNIYSYETYTAT